MDSVTGGVGGANEATCPNCGKSMPAQGDGTWFCSACNVTQFLSDAEYIEILKAAEAAGQTAGLVYPVWWNKIRK
jgi:ribosomal protein S27AE